MRSSRCLTRGDYFGGGSGAGFGAVGGVGFFTTLNCRFLSALARGVAASVTRIVA